MNDLDKTKENFKAIGCQFAHSPNLTGHTLIIYTDGRQIHFEYDLDGKFIKVITE